MNTTKSFDHSTEELVGLVHRQPVRIAQRLLRQYGDDTESAVIRFFPVVDEKRSVLDAVRQQRKTWENRNWNKGLVRTY